ncbi:MAG: DNA methyltransferase [Candidatus Desantisbacteria bacterium]
MITLANHLEYTEIVQYFKEKEIDKSWSFEGVKPLDTGKWTHCYHRYPAKFIPQLVEALIEEYIHSDDAHINDPFMGSGTTIVTAISKGFKASGTDINRIACLMTKVKSIPIKPDHLNKKINQILSKTAFLENKGIFVNETIPLIPEKHIERIDYWFSEENKIKLGKILRVIYEEEDKDVRDFFLIAFSHILKNCSIWLQGSTKPTRDLRKNSTEPCKAFRTY